MFSYHQKLLEHSVLQTFTAQGGMNGLNRIDFSRSRKVDAVDPFWVKFYIFQIKRSSTQRLVEEWTKYIQASSVNRDNIYIRI